MSAPTLFDPEPFTRPAPPGRQSPPRRRTPRRDPRRGEFARVYAATHDPGRAYRHAYGRLTRGGRLRSDAWCAYLGNRVLANPAVAGAVAATVTHRPLFDPDTGAATWAAWEPAPRPAPAPPPIPLPLPLPSPAPAPRRRVRRHPSQYRYVRYCKAGSYQARVPLGANRELGRTKGDAVNLGLFTAADWGEAAEWAAGRAAKEFVRRMQPGRDLCDVLDGLRRDRLIPGCVLPPRVFARAGGYGARLRRRGAVVAEVGPLPTPGEAYRALAAVTGRAG